MRKIGQYAQGRSREPRASDRNPNGSHATPLEAENSYSMKSKKELTAHSPEDILEELRSMVVEAEKMVGNAGERTEDTINSLRSRYNSAREQLSDFYEGARDRVVAGAKATDKTIRENPYTSLAIALGAGVLVGALVTRSRQN